MLTRRLALLKADLSEIEEVISAVEARELEPMYWLNLSYSRAIQVAEVKWLQQLLTDLDTNVIRWPKNGQPKQLVSKE